ncbi:metallophosphoesterase [Rhizobium sp. YIM 134829]|uniref:metallophosphoesterase n=1 Tax=Rhizobium sp. YIM 134829 TaxID=3390453 RepID=UPI00397E0B61
MRLFTRRGLLKSAGGLIVAGIATGAYGAGIEARATPRIARYSLRPTGWPEGLKLRLVLLADIHACEPYMPAARIAAICQHANALQGDLILLLGDFISNMSLSFGAVAAEAWGAALSTLSAPLGVHAIMGNHDWFDDPGPLALENGPTLSHRALAAIGVPVYDNQTIRLEKDGQPFWLAGLADQWGPREGLDDLPGTLARITDAAPVILMAHEPDIFPQVPARVAITLSGHTHGGQIRLFGYAPVVPSRFGNRYAYGHIVEGGRHLVVSGGLGTSILPFRLGSPPELTVVELG